MFKLKLFIVPFLIILYCFALNSKSLIAQNSVPLIANWDVGDSYNFEINKSSKYSNQYGANMSNTVSYISSFEVIEKDENGYTIKWIRNIDLESFHIPEHLISEFANYATYEVIYKTDSKGSFIAITNWEELREKKSNMYDEGMKILKKEKKKIRNDFLKVYRYDSEHFGTLELIHKKAFSEIWHFHYLYGLVYPVNEKIEFQINDKVYPNYDQVLMDVNLLVSEANESKFVIKKKVAVEEAEKKRFLSQVFDYAKVSPSLYNRLMKTGNLDFSQNVEYEFNHKVAIPERYDFKEEIIISAEGKDHSNSFEEVTLRLID